MLTLNYVLKVARLLDQTGEPRPGFLHDEKANLRGQDAGRANDYADSVEADARDQGGARTGTNVVLEYEEDPLTGDVRIVQRRLDAS